MPGFILVFANKWQSNLCSNSGPWKKMQKIQNLSCVSAQKIRQDEWCTRERCKNHARYILVI